METKQKILKAIEDLPDDASVEDALERLYRLGTVTSSASVLRGRAEPRRSEFQRLANQWRKDTVHLSQVSKKILHPAYFRIVGMGESAIPLLLEELRDHPAHWFVALEATSNTDPVPQGSNPAQAREAWLEWGRRNALLD